MPIVTKETKKNVKPAPAAAKPGKPVVNAKPGKPGLPIKTAPIAAASINEPVTQAAAPPVKRGPGRPPKNPPTVANGVSTPVIEGTPEDPRVIALIHDLSGAKTELEKLKKNYAELQGKAAKAAGTWHPLPEIMQRYRALDMLDEEDPRRSVHGYFIRCAVFQYRNPTKAQFGDEIIVNGSASTHCLIVIPGDGDGPAGPAICDAGGIALYTGMTQRNGVEGYVEEPFYLNWEQFGLVAFLEHDGGPYVSKFAMAEGENGMWERTAIEG